MTPLERAAIVLAQDIDADRPVAASLQAVIDAARAFAASLTDVAPGLDPTPAALAREVLKAAEKATRRPWRVWAQDPMVGCFWKDGLPEGSTCIEATNTFAALGMAVGATPFGHGRDAAFIIAACNAAETLARAVIEGEARADIAAEQQRETAAARDEAWARAAKAEIVAKDVDTPIAMWAPPVALRIFIGECVAETENAHGRVDGVEAERKAAASVFESREEWAKRAQAAEARVAELEKDLEAASDWRNR